MYSFIKKKHVLKASYVLVTMQIAKKIVTTFQTLNGLLF